MAIVENAVEGDVEDVWIVKAKHLCLLEWGHAASWGQHEYADSLAAAHGVFRRGAGIARGSAQDVDGFVAAAKLVFEKFAEQLHGHVFECSGWAFGKVAQVNVVLEFGDRNDVFAVELRVGVGACGDRLDVFYWDVINKQGDNFSSQSCVSFVG